MKRKCGIVLVRPEVEYLTDEELRRKAYIAAQHGRMNFQRCHYEKEMRKRGLMLDGVNRCIGSNKRGKPVSE